MPTKKIEEKSFEMKTEYWEITIEKADCSVIKFDIEFKDKLIPLGEMRKLEEALRKVLEACGRLETLQPSKRQ